MRATFSAGVFGVGLGLIAVGGGCASGEDESVRDEAASEAAVLASPEPVIAAPDVVTLRFSPQFVLEKVLARKNRPFDGTKPFPAIRFASETPLTEFQEAIEAQWGFRPDVITNAYSVATNTIYLMDNAPYYAAHGRCIDDSLAHELTHYVQVIYQGWYLDGADDSIELDAIDVQRWFRETFC